MLDYNDVCFSYHGKCASLSMRAPGFSGSASTEIRLSVPNARGLAPDCSVKWNFGGMNIFGRGCSFSLPYFERMTANGVPNYDCSDAFVHPSYGILHAGTPGASMRYYPCVDTGVSRIEYLSDTDMFREILRDGSVTLYKAGVRSPSGAGFLYYPAGSSETRGTTIRYHYLDTGEIARIEYGDLPGGGYAFVIDFSYEPRPDEEQNFRGGFSFVRAMRCCCITVSSVFGEKRKLREIAFTYDDTTGYSLLSRITETAFSGVKTETAPTIRISYQSVEEGTFSEITSAFSGTDIGAAVPVSLCREGACGLFVPHTSGAYYSAPLDSDGSAPRFAPKRLMEHLPAGFFPHFRDTLSRPYAGSFLDLDGDGETAWIAPGGGGYHAVQNGQFGTFTPFEGICPIGTGTEFADIYGDGKLSAFTVLLAGKQTRCEIWRGRGKKGFEPSQTVRLPDGFPAVSLMKTEFTGFSRFFGDGLAHRICIRNKSCTVFPNLGDGHFGEGIRIKNAPDFGSDFDAERIRFADTTGSGTDDIIYIEQTRILLYRNIAGAFFQPPVTIPLPDRFAPSDRIYIADFTGDLLPQLIFIKQAFPETRVYSLRFSHGFLVNGIENGCGLTFEMEYRSSAALILEASASGHPWNAVPPFPVPVVTKFTVFDGVTGERNTTDYSYRNGRYIKSSRFVYGFGTVEEKHTTAVPLPDEVPSDLQPPDRYITNEYFIGDSTEPSADVSALVGLPAAVRYSDADGTVLMQYAWTYRSQVLKDAPEGSYFPALVEEKSEQCGENPRISRTYMTYDEYGNMTVSETHYLPSQSTDASAEQRTEYISKQSCAYLNLDTTDTLLTGLPVREEYLAGTDTDGIFLVSSREYFYTDPYSNQPLPSGSCKIPALLHHTRDMVFSADDPVIKGLDDTLLNECGCSLENECYYISNETYEYDADCFFLLCRVTLGGSKTNISYDRWGIFVTGLAQTASNGLSLMETYAPDDATCTCASKTDMNGNNEYYLYDAFGELQGLSYRSAMSGLPEPQSLAEIISRPEAWLSGNVDAYFYHDRNAWEDSKAAPCQAAVIRKETEQPDAVPALTLQLTYMDGHGRGYGQAVRDTDHWILSEKVLRADGLNILEYPPCRVPDPQNKPDTYPTAYRYDILGRTIQVCAPYSDPSPLWRNVEIEYEPWSVWMTDTRLTPPAVSRFRQDLDPRGLVLTDVYESPDGDVLRSRNTRDHCGNLIAVSDGRLAASGLNNLSYSYDRLARCVKTVSADAGTSLNLYGTDGRLVYEDTNGTVKRYIYDDFGRFTSLTIQNGDLENTAGEQVVWGDRVPEATRRNLVGRIYQHTDLSGTITYDQYDRFGHALAVERSYSGDDAVHARYSYNLAGELKTAETEGFSLCYSYSPAGNLCTVSTPGGDILSRLSYTAAGNISSEACGSGLRLSQNYDPVTGFLTAQSAECGETRLYEASYHFTAQGNLSENTWKALGAEPVTASYSYDAHSRLIHAGLSQGAIHMEEDYGYDNGGNMVSFTRMQNSVPVITRSYEIASDSNRIKAAVINGVCCEFHYNDYGRPKYLANGQELSYDEFGRLSSAGCGQTAETYSYDADGRRAAKSDHEDHRTIYFHGNPLAGDFTRLSDGSEMLKLNFGGMLNTVLFRSNQEMLFLHQVTDHRGSVILTVNRSGTAVFHEYFSPYGEAAENVAKTEDPAPAPPTPYRFAGKEYDSRTGLYYFGARYYLPEDGRMLTPDNVQYAFPGGLSGLNLYTYCLGNPESLQDESGNFPNWIRIAANLAGGAVTGVMGVTLGLYYNALDTFRATAVAAVSSSVGAFIAAPGGITAKLTAAAVSAVRTGAYTALFNFGKNVVLKHIFPKYSKAHPAAVAYAVTGINIAAAATFAPDGFPGDAASSVPGFIGMLGGGELGVAGSFYAGETGIPVNPTPGDNSLSNYLHTNRKSAFVKKPLNIKRYAKHGIIDFSFYMSPSGKYHGQKGNGYTEHRVIEFNASEADQWGKTQDMADMMSFLSPTKTGGRIEKAALAVIVHGASGGQVFIDGNAPLAAGTLKPTSHTLISASDLADYIKMKVGTTLPRGSVIKLISCHGSESRLFVDSTAQTLADVTGMNVAAYHGPISIKDTVPDHVSAHVATMFTPHKHVIH